MNNQDITKFEFLLSLNDKIICQRFFNVRSHVPESKNSLYLHDYIKYICRDISEDLKTKTLDYLHANQQYINGLDNSKQDQEEENERYSIEIKHNDRVFIQRIFPSNVFHPKVRYAVDIRPSLKEYLSELTDILSTEELETTYLQYQL